MWTAFPTGPAGLAFDAPFERYVRGDNGGNLSLCRVGDQAPIAPLLPGDGQSTAFSSPSFSPDGHFLEQRSRSGRLKLWRLDGNRPVLVREATIPGRYYESTASFSADSRQLAVGQADGYVTVYETATGASVKQLKLGFLPGRWRSAPAIPTWQWPAKTRSSLSTCQPARRSRRRCRIPPISAKLPGAPMVACWQLPATT